MTAETGSRLIISTLKSKELTFKGLHGQFVFFEDGHLVRVQKHHAIGGVSKIAGISEAMKFSPFAQTNHNAARVTDTRRNDLFRFFGR